MNLTINVPTGLHFLDHNRFIGGYTQSDHWISDDCILISALNIDDLIGHINKGTKLKTVLKGYKHFDILESLLNENGMAFICDLSFSKKDLYSTLAIVIFKVFFYIQQCNSLIISNSGLAPHSYHILKNILLPISPCLEDKTIIMVKMDINADKA